MDFSSECWGLETFSYVYWSFSFVIIDFILNFCSLTIYVMMEWSNYITHLLWMYVCVFSMESQLTHCYLLYILLFPEWFVMPLISYSKIICVNLPVFILGVGGSLLFFHIDLFVYPFTDKNCINYYSFIMYF